MYACFWKEYEAACLLVQAGSAVNAVCGYATSVVTWTGYRVSNRENQVVAYNLLKLLHANGLGTQGLDLNKHKRKEMKLVHY